MILEEQAASRPVEMEAMLCGTRAQCNNVNRSSGVVLVGTVVKFSDYIKLLGVKLDPAISMNHHETELVRSCNYHIRALQHIRPLLTLESTKMVALDIVSECLDYCNSFLYDTSSDNLRKLQVTQNALARVVCQAARTCIDTKLCRIMH